MLDMSCFNLYNNIGFVAQWRSVGCVKMRG